MTELTKWPLLLVRGEPITEAQANEVLIRTNFWGGGTNDRDFERDVLALAGIEAGEYRWPTYDSVKAFNRRHDVLELLYLYNSRIYSSYIGGPHGWCNWDGTIGCANYNIGKWPSVEEVTQDWEKIAEAFPFLNLVAQLVPDEGEAKQAAVGFMIWNGKVSVAEGPADPIIQSSEFDAEGFMVDLMSHGRERGVSLERLAAALDQVRAR